MFFTQLNLKLEYNLDNSITECQDLKENPLNYAISCFKKETEVLIEP